MDRRRSSSFRPRPVRPGCPIRPDQRGRLSEESRLLVYTSNDYGRPRLVALIYLMQTLIQIYCHRGPSLRERIAVDKRLPDHLLRVVAQQKPGRSHGWMKIRSTNPGRRGAMNVQWDTDSSAL